MSNPVNNPAEKLRGVRPFSRDRLFLIPREEAAKGAMSLLHVLQDEAPEVSLASVSVLFAAWCRRLKMDPFQAHELGLKLIGAQQFHEKANAQVEVLRDFAGLRMAGDASVDVRGYDKE